MPISQKLIRLSLGNTIECVHIGFAEEKRAYILYSCEWQCLIESRDVEFEEVENEGQERITPDLDTSDEDPDMDTDIDHNSTLEDSGGGQKSTLNPQGNDLLAPELSSPSLTIPTSIPPHRSNHPNKGIPPPRPDKDPKLSLGSRPKTTETGPIPSQGAPSVGTNNSPVDNTDHMALFLTTDALHSYWDAMGRCKHLNSELGAQTVLHLSVSKGVIQRKRESRSSATSSSNDNSRPGPMAQAVHTGMKYVLFT